MNEIVSLTSFSLCLSLVFKKATDVDALILSKTCYTIEMIV